MHCCIDVAVGILDFGFCHPSLYVAKGVWGTPFGLTVGNKAWMNCNAACLKNSNSIEKSTVVGVGGYFCPRRRTGPGLLDLSVGHSTAQQFGISTASTHAIPPLREAR